ncbi:MAG: ADP-glyceromanno-heptose 6-epimerase [Bacteroidetes bacterium]|nr:ADP-glyceromanno-heptose 6-epimerase [Bacteroidota bacterium]
MLVVTGAAGFIGSCLVSRLNREGHTDLILVDDFSHESKTRNLEGKKYAERIHRDVFIDWLAGHAGKVEAVLHIGARTDTTEFDRSIFERLNINYTKDIWRLCTQHQIPLIYASSAATYGLGEHGYDDNHDIIPKLRPLNPYGDSKNEVDQWILQQTVAPPHWYGLKFFNVYGPNEYHKGRMASVIFHAFRQITATGGMKLFRSHNPEYKDGEQLRDFIYVKDVTDVIYFLLTKLPESGIYNLGTGEARTFLDLARSTFAAMQVSENISFVDTPADIRDKYQYFTEANMQKLRKAGYQTAFHTLEEGVADYVQFYLQQNNTL